jgi:hypothetical protein
MVLQGAAMRLAIIAFVMLLLTAAAMADPPSWPITPDVDLSAVSKGGAAVVKVLVGDDAKSVDIKVYGQDGLVVGKANKMTVHRDHVAKGETVTFHIVVHPGAGRSYVVVDAKATFAHAGRGGTVRSFPVGTESAAQQAEHSKCVRQDPDGVWIRVPGCDDDAPSAASSPTVTLEQLMAPPAGVKLVRVTAFVVGGYLCPPCPPGAQCKPCMSASFVSLALSADQPAQAKVSVRDPGIFQHGVKYEFEVDVTQHEEPRFVGTLVQSRSAGGGSWRAEPAPLGKP